ncbi:MAG: CmcI family methyltransferase [Fimbriimonas sp.]
MFQPNLQELLEKARAAKATGEVLVMLRAAEEGWRADPTNAEIGGLVAEGLSRLGRTAEVAQVAESVLLLDPDAATALEVKKSIESIKASDFRPLRWDSSLPSATILQIEQAAHRTTYRGHAMIKNPFDLALMPMLLRNLRPQTIIEIGSFNGASALWMADTLRLEGTSFHIHSVDIVKVTTIEDPQITYHQGSGRELASLFTPERLAKLPHPLLVIDDADHQRQTTSAILEFFHPHMHSGDYFVIEDGLTAEGTRQALEAFFDDHFADYMVDPEYCDFYGYNATWCVNGFLKRL